MDSSATLLAILLGIAIHPFFANHLSNQRQNAAAVIGVVLLGFVVLEQDTFPDLAHGGVLHTAFNFVSFLFFVSAFLGRKRGSLPTPPPPLLPFSLACTLSALDMFVPSTEWYALFSVAQAGCLLAIIKTYAGLPTPSLIKGIFFSVMYCAVNMMLHLTLSPSFNSAIPAGTVGFLYFLLLITCVLHMVFQDFSRIRTRKGMEGQAWIDQEIMRLAFRGRRLLKDFRHDLRQPLSTLGILASVGKAISKDAEVTARYQHIQTAQKALKNMLEEFFDELGEAIRYPQNNKTAPMQEVALDEVLAPLIEEYRMLANEKDLQIRYVATSLRVISNKEALVKIVRNGLDNAVKYTNKGGIVVGLRHRRGKVCIQIIDTGSGVDNNKVAAHNKGWGHGASIIKDLSEQILAKTECRNRHSRGQIRGSVFEVTLPEEAEVTRETRLAAFATSNAFDAQVMATNQEHLLEIKRILPVQGFDYVEFTLNGAYRAYLNALRKGMCPVYILYSGNPEQRQQALEQLRLLACLLDFQPCCILIYKARTGSGAQVEFGQDVIQIPVLPGQTSWGLGVISELFPGRTENLPIFKSEPEPSLSVDKPLYKVLMPSQG